MLGQITLKHHFRTKCASDWNSSMCNFHRTDTVICKLLVVQNLGHYVTCGNCSVKLKKNLKRKATKLYFFTALG